MGEMFSLLLFAASKSPFILIIMFDNDDMPFENISHIKYERKSV